MPEKKSRRGNKKTDTKSFRKKKRFLREGERMRTLTDQESRTRSTKKENQKQLNPKQRTRTRKHREYQRKRNVRARIAQTKESN